MEEEKEIELVIDWLMSQVLQLLVTEKGYSFVQALDCLYSSRTCHALERHETELYNESPVYLYDCIQHEVQD